MLILNGSDQRRKREEKEEWNGVKRWRERVSV